MDKGAVLDLRSCDGFLAPAYNQEVHEAVYLFPKVTVE